MINESGFCTSPQYVPRFATTTAFLMTIMGYLGLVEIFFCNKAILVSMTQELLGTLLPTGVH